MTARRHRVELAVIRECQRPAVGAREEPDRVRREPGHRHRLSGIPQTALVDVERAALLRQVIEVVVVRIEDRIPVLAVERRQLRVLLRFRVVDPDVAGHGRCVMFSPVALVAFVIVEEDLVARRAHRGVQRRRRQHDRHPPSGHRDGVQLTHAAGGKLHVGGQVLPRGAEEHGAVVGRERARDFTRGVIRQPLRLAAVRRHDEHVEIAVPIGGERHRLPIVAPHRCELVRLAEGQRNRIAARRRHRPDVTLVLEEQGLAVGRNGWIPQPQRRRVFSHLPGRDTRTR